MSSRKRQKLTSPSAVNSNSQSSPTIIPIEISPISDEDEQDTDEVTFIPIIQVEDISDSETETDTVKKRTPSKALPYGPSPLKILTQAKMTIFQNPDKSSVSLLSRSLSDPLASTSKTDVQSSIVSSNVSSTTSMLSPFHTGSAKTMGSPKYMVQEITSTVNEKRFLLTALPTNTKERLRVMIKKLGGIYIDSPNFVDNCTHIVLGKPNTGEKYLGGLICGKWCLRTEYIEESYVQEYWLEESPFEWSLECLTRNGPNTDKELGRLSVAARRCRRKYNAEGPFHNWTAIILSNHPRRQECYERLFKAGGGRVINIADYQKRRKELKYILLDNPEQTHIPRELKSTTIPLLKINYLHDVVLEDSLPDISNYMIKKEKEEAANMLPKVHMIYTFVDVRKHINLATETKVPNDIDEFVRTSLENGHTNNVLLPLLVMQILPNPQLILYFILNFLLPAQTETMFRQCVSDLHVLSWFVAPTHSNREYYKNLLDEKTPTEAFIHLLLDSVKTDEVREYKQSPRYIIWWIKLIEKDFANWQKLARNKPLVEQLFNVWHYPKKILRVFMRVYDIVILSKTAHGSLKRAFNSLLVVLFTSNEIKKIVKLELEKKQLKQKVQTRTTTLDVIVDGVHATFSSIIRKCDILQIHIILSYLAFSVPMSVSVLDKILINLNKTNVPDHYRCLADRVPSWEKYYNYYAHLEFTLSLTETPTSSDTEPIENSDPNQLLTKNTEIYLILLSAMFRALYSQSKPPAMLNPYDKTVELKYKLRSYANSSSVFIINLLMKSCQIRTS